MTTLHTNTSHAHSSGPDATRRCDKHRCNQQLPGDNFLSWFSLAATWDLSRSFHNVGACLCTMHTPTHARRHVRLHTSQYAHPPPPFRGSHPDASTFPANLGSIVRHCQNGNKQYLIVVSLKRFVLLSAHETETEIRKCKKMK